MINKTHPDTWQGLQDAVCQILTECGMLSEVEKSIQTVRGKVNIDVYAQDISQTPNVTYLCECKHWGSKISKTVVHAFRTVVNDYGANIGLIISSKGFQKGAYEAIHNSNIQLLTWDEFEDIFEDGWYKNYMSEKIKKAYPIIDYTEPINSIVFRKADALSENDRKKFILLRKKYQIIAAMILCSIYRPGLSVFGKPKLPADIKKINLLEDEGLLIPGDLFGANALREYMDLLLKYAYEGIEEFDNVFGSSLVELYPEQSLGYLGKT